MSAKEKKDILPKYFLSEDYIRAFHRDYEMFWQNLIRTLNEFERNLPPDYESWSGKDRTEIWHSRVMTSYVPKERFEQAIQSHLLGDAMLLRDYDRKSLIHEYDSVSGEIKGNSKIGCGNPKISSQIRGQCKETSEGWAAVYGDGEDLYFQINSHKWKLGHEATKLSCSTLDDAHFSIKNEDHSFEISYRYRMTDALMSDLDDPDSNHDFFAYVV